MTRNCDVCRSPYEAKRPNSKFCSDRCRKRSQRAPDALVPPFENPHEPVDGPGALTMATFFELEAAGRAATSVGIAAILLAQRLDRPTADTGSSIAALVREHRATLAEAVRGAAAADPMDELRAARDRKRAAS